MALFSPFVFEVNRLFPTNVYDNVASGEGKTPTFWRILIFLIEVFLRRSIRILIMIVTLTVLGLDLDCQVPDVFKFSV